MFSRNVQSELVDRGKFYWSDFAPRKFVFFAILNKWLFNLRSVCYFLQFKKQTELSTAFLIRQVAS